MNAREELLRTARESLAEVGEIIGSLPPDSEAYHLATRALRILRQYLRDQEQTFAAKTSAATDGLFNGLPGA